MQDEMTNEEIINAMLQVVDRLVETSTAHSQSIKNFDDRLAEIRDALGTHENCIMELQEAVIELRRVFDMMRDLREEGRSISSGGIIL